MQAFTGKWGQTVSVGLGLYFCSFPIWVKTETENVSLAHCYFWALLYSKRKKEYDKTNTYKKELMRSSARSRNFFSLNLVSWDLCLDLVIS
jgi:hypothetical protein